MGNERMPAVPGQPSPWDVVDQCAAALKEAAGPEILANAAGVVALFAAITIPVDASGHKSLAMARIQPVMNRIVRWTRKTKDIFHPCCHRRAASA